MVGAAGWAGWGAAAADTLLVLCWYFVGILLVLIWYSVGILLVVCWYDVGMMFVLCLKKM